MTSRIVVSNEMPPYESPMPHTVIESGTYRLEIGCGYGVALTTRAEDVLKYVGHLQEVEFKELADDDRRCCICLTSYNDRSRYSGEEETPIRLGCGHVLGADCFLTLIGPKEDGGWESDKCPICRAKIAIDIHIVPTEGSEEEE